MIAGAQGRRGAEEREKAEHLCASAPLPLEDGDDNQ
jgi:hypothetical protein